MKATASTCHGKLKHEIGQVCKKHADIHLQERIYNNRTQL